jgi:hypothetical protein
MARIESDAGTTGVRSVGTTGPTLFEICRSVPNNGDVTGTVSMATSTAFNAVSLRSNVVEVLGHCMTVNCGVNLAQYGYMQLDAAWVIIV